MKPHLILTLGDVAGIGPEIVAKAWPELGEFARVTVFGDPAFLPPGIACENRSPVNLNGVQPGRVSAAAGRAAYDWLVAAIDDCLAGRADGIVTCPLHKEGFHAAGIVHPGHTEVLGQRTGSASFAMLLYDDELPLAVTHVTLHRSIQTVPEGVSVATVLGNIRLLNEMLPRLLNRPARIAVSALNPHASDGGLFGNEEAMILAPAIALARSEGIDVVGPIAADAIFLPHNRARYEGIVAMYHDQGHIAMKLLGGRRAVNISAGLPIVRTSVAHGTAYDIVGQNRADASSLVAAVRIAARLANSSSRVPSTQAD